MNYQRLFSDRNSQCAWDGLDKIKPSIQRTKFNPAQSQKRYNEWMQARLSGISSILKHSPIVILTGLRGVGKSSFMQDVVQKQGYPVYYGASDETLTKWTQSSGGLLFIDEANIDRHWTCFEGLYAPKPHVLINGHIYPVTPQHRVVFACNPYTYGDERIQPLLFERRGHTLIFQPLSAEVIYTQVLAMIFQTSPLLNDEARQMIANCLFNVYHYALSIAQNEVYITPRQISNITWMILNKYEEISARVQKPEQKQQCLKNLTYWYAFHGGFDCIPPMFHGDYENKVLPKLRKCLKTVPERPLRNWVISYSSYITFKHWQPVPSQWSVIEKLVEFLHVRAYQKKSGFVDSAKHGLNRLIIEGEPGVGKSTLCMEAFQSMKLKNAINIGTGPVMTMCFIVFIQTQRRLE